jgi:hypothetical protein
VKSLQSVSSAVPIEVSKSVITSGSKQRFIMRLLGNWKWEEES